MVDGLIIDNGFIGCLIVGCHLFPHHGSLLKVSIIVVVVVIVVIVVTVVIVMMVVVVVVEEIYEGVVSGSKPQRAIVNLPDTLILSIVCAIQL